MKTRIARREFLIQLTQGFAGLALHATLAETLFGQILQRAYAASLNQEQTYSGNYVHFSFPGAPPRWLFDLALTPYGQTAKNFNPGAFGTVITKSGVYPTAEHYARKIEVGGKALFLPPVWSMSPSGQDFKTVLQHSILVRGIDMEIDNHLLSNSRQVAPTIGGYSLHGMVADASSLPIPCVIDPGSQAALAFRSKKGLATSNLNYAESQTTNPVGTLLTPFKPFAQDRRAHSATPIELQHQALKQFEKYAEMNNLTASSITNMYDNAIELLDRNVFALSSKWTTTVAKYRNLIQSCIQTSYSQMPGLFDQKVNVQNNLHFNYMQSGERFKMADARDMISESLNVPRMAENFAAAEILLGDLTSSLSLGFPNFNGVKTGVGPNTFSLTHDQHFLGSVPMTLLNTLFYRCFLSCLTEFVNVLKEKRLFDQTVLHIGSEFNRLPRTNGSGADHNPHGSSATLISGMISSPTVIGNIQVKGLTPNYTGTTGIAVNYSLDGFNRPIQVNDIARTVCGMLGVHDIVTNGRSLVNVSKGKAVVKKDEANNV